MRCLCCNKDIDSASEYEKQTGWHSRCIKRFFGTNTLPELYVNNQELEELANKNVNQKLTVPGVQKKLSLHLSKDAGSFKLTIVDYPTGYILKPGSDEYENLPEAEFLSMKMAERVGIPVVPNALIKTGESLSYITKRIDRSGDKMFAMEDFCQLSGRMTSDKYKSSYENCGKVIAKFSQNVGLDETELFYRLVFCFITGNSDMHLKNFSLIESSPTSRIFGLSPAYDMLPVNVLVPADKEQMALTMNGKKRNIRKKDFIALSNNLGISDKVAKRLIDRLISQKEILNMMVSESYMSIENKEALSSLIIKRIKVFE